LNIAFLLIKENKDAKMNIIFRRINGSITISQQIVDFSSAKKKCK